MTPDDLRAIAAGEYATVQSEYFVIGVPPTPTARILARTLLAVLDMCKDHAPNIGCMSYVTPIDPLKLRELIQRQLKEAK